MDITNIGDFLGIAIVGVALSLVLELIQAKFGTGSVQMRALTIVLAIIVGSVYVLFRETLWWQTMLGILAAASAVYAMFFSGVSRSQ